VHSAIGEQAARFFDAVFLAQKDYLPVSSGRGYDQVHWLPPPRRMSIATRPATHLRRGFVGNIAISHRRTPCPVGSLLAARFRCNDFYRFYPPEEVGADSQPVAHR
jgi:hypothetical protein